MKIKLLNENAKIPTKGSLDAAGWDLYSSNTENIIIKPGETIKIPTGIATELPINTFGGIFPRSGLATKQGLRLANCVAVIDSDYRGEWFIPIYNDSNKEQVINPGERIAQMILLPYIPMEFTEVEELSDTVRGSGGFGSTGE